MSVQVTTNDYMGMKRAFKRAMLQEWGANGRFMQPVQIRGLLKIFVLGWTEAMIVGRVPIMDWQTMYGHILNNPDWYPDESWHWWNDVPGVNGSSLVLPGL